MADREKGGEDGNSETWISQEQKELFRWNKKHFSQFLKGYNLVRNKNLKKIEDTGLEITQLALTCSKLTMETPKQFEKFVKI